MAAWILSKEGKRRLICKSFDCRILMSGITKDQWPLFAKDIFRICKLGVGWAQLIEACAFLSCDDDSVPKDSPIWKVILFSGLF